MPGRPSQGSGPGPPPPLPPPLPAATSLPCSFYWRKLQAAALPGLVCSTRPGVPVNERCSPLDALRSPGRCCTIPVPCPRPRLASIHTWVGSTRNAGRNGGMPLLSLYGVHNLPTQIQRQCICTYLPTSLCSLANFGRVRIRILCNVPYGAGITCNRWCPRGEARGICLPNPACAPSCQALTANTRYLPTQAWYLMRSCEIGTYLM